MAGEESISDKDLIVLKTPTHRMELSKESLIISRKVPPAERSIKYEEIASVEHTRLIDYGLLLWVAIPLAVIYALNYLKFVKDITVALVDEIKIATGSSFTTPEGATFWLSVLFFLVSAYYMLRFGRSLQQRLILYRTGKKPIAVTFSLTGDSLAFLAGLNKRVKEASGVSKDEVQALIGDQIRTLLDQRVQMQKQMLDSFKIQILAAKTKADKEKLKSKMRESIEKLEAQDEIIDRELKKTGLKKEDIFKKYRIKAPKEEFIDSVLEDGDLSKLMSE